MVCRLRRRVYRGSPPRRAARRRDKQSGAWHAQLSRTSRGIRLLVPPGAIGFPSVPRRGLSLFSTPSGVICWPATDAPGGGSSGPLRPQADKPTDAARAPIRARRRTGQSECLTARTPCIETTIAKQANKAKSGFFFFELAQPFFRLRAHIFRRGTTETGPAFYRPVQREDTEYVFADPRLHLPHGR